MTLEDKTNKWTLRFFESLWAIQVNYVAADINDLGLAQYLEEYKVSAISCRFGVVGTASLRSWYRCSTYPVLQGVFFHS